MPPPTGVVSGPLMPIRCSRNPSTVASGSQSPVASNAFWPARTSFQAIVLPCFAAAASNTSCEAGQMSTPVPSPSMNGMMGSSGTFSCPSVRVIFSGMWSASCAAPVGKDAQVTLLPDAGRHRQGGARRARDRAPRGARGMWQRRRHVDRRCRGRHRLRPHARRHRPHRRGRRGDGRHVEIVLPVTAAVATGNVRPNVLADVFVDGQDTTGIGFATGDVRGPPAIVVADGARAHPRRAARGG